MTQNKSSNHEKETPSKSEGIEASPPAEAEVDEYTAKMDRLVNSLKKRSQTAQQNEFKSKLIWIGVGIVVAILAIYIMLNVSFEGKPLEFLSR